MNKRNLLLVLIVLLSVVVGLILGNMLAERAILRSNNAFGRFFNGSSNDKLSEVLSLINSQYVDTVDVNQLSEEMMTDLISKLDPHSVYIPASDLEGVNSEL